MSEFDQFRRQLAELGSSLNDLEYSDARQKFDNLQKIFEVDLSTIPDHEQKLANREIHDLHKKIEKKKPKKSFALKKKTKKPVEPKPVEPEADSVIESKTDETQSALEIKPIYIDLKDQKLEYETKNEEENILIRNVENCSFIIRGNCSSFTLENAKNTNVEMDNCVFGAAMVRDSSDCNVSLTSRQLRIRNVNNSRFYVAVCSKIALEESNGLIFSRNPKEAEHQEIMKKSKMNLMTDSFKEINDFEWPDSSRPSPHWTAQ